MRLTETTIRDVIIIEPERVDDHRGMFMETWRRDTFRAAGISADFVQDNHSRSVRGVLRGLHYQLPHPQGKLVRVILGEVADVAVDLRRSSPTFGRHVVVHLDAEQHRQLWIPPGFAHGYSVLSASADLVYKCTDFYEPHAEHTIRWDDPDLAIRWPLPSGQAPLISDKDAAGTPFRLAPHFE